MAEEAPATEFAAGARGTWKVEVEGVLMALMDLLKRLLVLQENVSSLDLWLCLRKLFRRYAFCVLKNGV